MGKGHHHQEVEKETIMANSDEANTAAVAGLPLDVKMNQMEAVLALVLDDHDDSIMVKTNQQGATTSPTTGSTADKAKMSMKQTTESKGNNAKASVSLVVDTAGFSLKGPPGATSTKQEDEMKDTDTNHDSFNMLDVVAARISSNANTSDAPELQQKLESYELKAHQQQHNKETLLAVAQTASHLHFLPVKQPQWSKTTPTNNNDGTCERDDEEVGLSPETRRAFATNMAAAATTSRPGAYSLGGTPTPSEEFSNSAHGEEDNDSDDEEVAVPSTSSSSGYLTVNNEDCSGLVVANPVDEVLPHQLQQAHQVEGEQQQQATTQMDHKSQQTNKLFLDASAILLVAVIIIIVIVAVVLASTKDDNNPSNTGSPSISPSKEATTPISAQEFLLSLLDNHDTTIQALEDPDSPQSRAYQWLLEDSDNWPSYSMQEARIKQKFALATLYHATGGDDWNGNTNWLDHRVHECQWYNKPDFARMDTVSKLYPGFLAGFFPSTEPSPTTCDKNGIYQNLWLDHNDLGGSVPEELYLLSSLKTFSIEYNRMHGTVPSLIGQLTSLEGLCMGPFADNGLIPSELGRLTKLRYLGLRSNSPEESFQGAFPSEIWQLTNLDTLNLPGNSRLQGSIPSIIGNLKKLRWLNFDDCDFSGSIPPEIGHATSLGWLILHANRMSGTLPRELKELSKLKILSLFENSFRGAIPSELGQLTSLLLFSARDNQLTGPVPSEVGFLTNLRVHLNLRNNHLGQSIPTEIGLLSGLKDLDLQNNNLSGPVPSELAQLVSIGHLTLANNSLSGTVPEELSTLQKSLYTLRLENNSMLYGSVPPGVCHLNGTCIGIAINSCQGPFGLFFDCSDKLCGCDCPCMNV